VEAFSKAFLAAQEGYNENESPTEIMEMAKAIKGILKTRFPEHPTEIWNSLQGNANALDKIRNRFSEAHFDAEATRWLAAYARDLANTHARLLLSFI
jgi:flavorubredoxin